MAWSDRALEFLSLALGQAAEGAGRFGRLYLSVLFNPRRELGSAASGVTWSFPLVLVIGYSALATVLLKVGWPMVAEGTVKLPVFFFACLVFFFALGLSVFGGVRLFGGQRVTFLCAMNCVGVAIVPLSSLTVAAWVVLFLSPGLSLLVMVFAVFVSYDFFVEALETQYDLPVGCRLYVLPLAVAAALLAMVLFLLALSGRSVPQ